MNELLLLDPQATGLERSETSGLECGQCETYCIDRNKAKDFNMWNKLFGNKCASNAIQILGILEAKQQLMSLKLKYNLVIFL